MTTPTETTPMSLSQRFADTDSHSDSDWLDISSNPDLDDSDDDGSVSLPDSDHPATSATARSRRSSISSASSKAGDVEAWEGFVSESDDDVPATGHVSNPHPSLASPATDTPFIDPEADQRATLALEQSLVSTLSSSRSNSHPSTVQNSVRDLRLSFPDPLNSSRDEPAVYSTVIPEDDSMSEDLDDPKENVDMSLEHKPEDVNFGEKASSTTASSAISMPPHSGPSMEVDLYGLRWIGRLEFVTRLLEKTMPDSSVVIHDHTWDRDEKVRGEKPTPSVTIPESWPSLAVIFLPNTSDPIAFVREHSFYLPVIIDSQWDDAQSQCDSLRIPSEKIFPVQQLNGMLFQAALVDVLEPGVGEAAFRSLAERTRHSVASSCKKFVRDPLHSVTFFALVYIVLSFFTHTFVPSIPMAATPTRYDALNASVTSAVSIRSPSSISVHSMFSLPHDQTSQGGHETADHPNLSMIDQAYSTAVALRSSAALAIPTAQKTSPSDAELKERDAEAENVASTSTQSLSFRVPASISNFLSQSPREMIVQAKEHIIAKNNRAKENARGIKRTAQDRARELKEVVGSTSLQISETVEGTRTQVLSAVEDTRVQLFHAVENSLQKLDSVEETGAKYYNEWWNRVNERMEKAQKRANEQKRRAVWGSGRNIASRLRLRV